MCNVYILFVVGMRVVSVLLHTYYMLPLISTYDSHASYYKCTQDMRVRNKREIILLGFALHYVTRYGGLPQLFGYEMNLK